MLQRRNVQPNYDIMIWAAAGYNGVVRLNDTDIQLTQSSSDSEFWYGDAPLSVTKMSYFLKHANVEQYNSTSVYIKKVKFGTGMYAKTSGLTNLWYAFACNNSDSSLISEIDVTNINTSGVTTMYSTFNRCGKDNPSGVSIIGIEDWDVFNVSTFQNMFNICRIKEGVVDLHKWRVRSGVTVSAMFGILSELAAEAINTCFYYTPGYWLTNPMSQANSYMAPVVYPYHDFNAAAESSYDGTLQINATGVTMTKDNTLGIWYYDLPSGTSITTLEFLMGTVSAHNYVTSFSIGDKLDGYSVGSLFGALRNCVSIRTFRIPSLVTTSLNQTFRNPGSNLVGLFGLDKLQYSTSTIGGGEQTFRDITAIRYIDMSSVTYDYSVNYYMNGCTNLIRISNMPGLASTVGGSAVFTGCSNLVYIENSGPIYKSIDLSPCPLNVSSAKVILRALQTVTSETIYFSDTTWGYILGDDDAIELLESAYDRGWSSNEPDIQIIAASGFNGVVRVNEADKTLTQSTSNTELWYGSAGTVTSLHAFLKHHSGTASIPYNSTSTNIKKVRFGKNINTSSCTSLYFSFACSSSDCSNLTKIDVRHLNTANVTSMRGTFANMNYLPLKEIIGVENFNTGKVTDFQNMFLSSYLMNKTFDLKGWHVLSSANIAAMFGTLDNYASKNISTCFFYTPGYWAKDPLTNISGAHCKPVVYPYHDITVAANSSYTGAAKVNGSDVTLTKNATLGIWYYDLPSGTVLTTLGNAFRNNITSISIRKGLNESADGVNLNSFASTADSLYTVYFGIKKVNNNIAWLFDYGNSGSALLNSFYGLDEADAPNDTFITAIVRGCPVLRFVCLPSMSGTTSSSNQPFRGCTNLKWISNLPGIKQEDTNFCYGCSSLTTIIEASPIYETVSFADSPLTLDSAKVILEQLKTVSGKTLTFSSTTKGYINADSEALSLVTAARNKGWTISL